MAEKTIKRRLQDAADASLAPMTALSLRPSSSWSTERP